jgi:hypothetical protein
VTGATGPSGAVGLLDRRVLLVGLGFLPGVILGLAAARATRRAARWPSVR